MTSLIRSMAVLTLVSLVGCTHNQTQTTAAHVTGREWKLVALNGKPIQADRAPTLQLEDGRVSGFGGVNRFTSTYTIDGQRLSFSKIASTRMAGEPALMKLEDDYLKELNGVDRFAIDSSELRLFSKDQVVATFR